MTDSLKPCPWCGSHSITIDADEIGTVEGWAATAKCDDCGSLGPEPDAGKDEDEAREFALSAWNRRTPLQPTAGMREALEKARPLVALFADEGRWEDIQPDGPGTDHGWYLNISEAGCPAATDTAAKVIALIDATLSAPSAHGEWRPPVTAPTKKGTPILLKVTYDGGPHIAEGRITEGGCLWIPAISFKRDDPQVVGWMPLAIPAPPAEGASKASGTAAAGEEKDEGARLPDRRIRYHDNPFPWLTDDDAPAEGA